jgi:hypothetical protein
VKLNTFKSKEVKPFENESYEEQEILVLEQAISSKVKKELMDQLILLMVPIISWKEFPNWINSEWAISIFEKRNLIKALRIENSSQLDENYVTFIWNVCFERARLQVRAELGAKKIAKEKVKNLTREEVFEYDYALSTAESNAFSKTSFGKNFPIFIASIALLFTFSIALFNLELIPLGKSLAFIFFEISTLLMLMAYTTMAIVSPVFRWLYGITSLLIFAFLITVGAHGPQLVKPSTPTVPQSSPVAKPTSGQKPGFTEPLKNSQSIHQKENR